MATSPTARRLWAVIPAAGLSRRMGRPKLLLDLGGRSVIARLVDALQSGGCEEIWVLVRRDDEPLRAALADLRVHCHTVEAPTADMRASVEQLLNVIGFFEHPRPDDAWLLCPADHPVLSATVVQSLLAEWRRHPDAVIAPSYAGRRGHPTLFPWRLADQVHSLSAHQGINTLLRQPDATIREVPVDDPSILLDLDTGEDYERLLRQFAEHGF